MNVELSRQKDIIVLRNKLLIYESLVAQKLRNYETIAEHTRKLKQRIESQLKKAG